MDIRTIRLFVHFELKQHHLYLAKQRLMQMDYIVDLKYQNQTCQQNLFEYMRIENSEGHENAKGIDYASDFHRKDLLRLNTLDLELYSFSSLLIDLDCEFLGMVTDAKKNYQ